MLALSKKSAEIEDVGSLFRPVNGGGDAIVYTIEEVL